VIWGGQESGEFARQSTGYRDTAVALGNPVELSAIDGADHFTVIHGLEDANSPVCRWLHQKLTA
jgi:arylformamidase